MANRKQKEGKQTFRKERFDFQLRRFRKLWKVYYRSHYGKAGFYILLFFAVIALLSPLLELHQPLTFFAPTEDTYRPTVELSSYVAQSFANNGTVNSPSASTLASQGSYLLYAGTPGGLEYGLGLGGSPTTFNQSRFLLESVNVSGGYAYSPTVFSLSNYTYFLSKGYSAFQYNNYLLVGTSSGELSLSQIQWLGSRPGAGKPHLVYNETTSVNGTIVMRPVSSSPPSVSPLPAWVPFYQKSAASTRVFQSGYVFVVDKNSSNNTFYLQSYYDNPLSPHWSVKLPGNSMPSSPTYYGTNFAPNDVPRAAVIIAQGSTLYSYGAGYGNLLWQSNFSSPVNTTIAPLIPADYQLGINTYNIALVSSGNSLYAVYLSNGTQVKIFSSPTQMLNYGTTQGSSGSPSYIDVTTPGRLFVLAGVGKVSYRSSSIVLPSVNGMFSNAPLYDPDTSGFILSTPASSVLAVSVPLYQYPIQWFASYSTGITISSPILFKNAATGRTSFGFVTGNGHVVAYSGSGKDINPIPPTLHAPSGNVYLFGTNIYGQDLWSFWVASFPVDWEIGLLVALGTVIISIIFAMAIGYIGGFLGSVLETFSLVIFLIPFIALLIVMSSILPKNFFNIILILTAVGWPFATFTLIGVVKSLRTHSFIEAAKVSGAGSLQILRRHMLNNMTPLLAYLTALGIGGAVAGVSTLQFLGVASLKIPTWGSMLNALLSNFYIAAQAPWWVLPPTIALTMFVFAFVFVSRGLDEVVNPRLRRR